MKKTTMATMMKISKKETARSEQLKTHLLRVSESREWNGLRVSEISLLLML